MFLNSKGRVALFSSVVLISVFTGIYLSAHLHAQIRSAKPLAPDAGTISGRVFQDYNENGSYDSLATGTTSVDIGVAGVTVSAYDAAGALRGSTTSAADGNFSLSATGTGPYRVEFTTLPTGYTPSARSTDSLNGGTAANSGSTVQFVNNGSTPNVNLALQRYEEYCQDNPTVVTSRFAQDASNGMFATNPALFDFPYTAGTTYTDATVGNYDNPTTHTLTTRISALGTVYGTAYNPFNNRIYASSFFKRHGGFGPGADGILNNSDDPGAVYVVNPSSSAVTATITVPGATTNSHQTGNYGNDNGNTGWDAVGKSSLGGISLSDDGSLLYVMNLENRRLYSFNTTSRANVGSTAAGAITGLTLPTPSGDEANCSNGGSVFGGGTTDTNYRPFAVKYYRGNVYIGVQCTAEVRQGFLSSQAGTTAGMFLYIFQISNPTAATMTIDPTPVFSMPLDYPRGQADPGEDAEWLPWVTTVQSNFAYPQPIFSDMEFTPDALVISIRDRAGDQEYDATANGKRTAGDILKACGSFGNWTLESNGRCAGGGTAAQGTGQGPGNGEFFWQDDFCLTPNGHNYHDEVSWGSSLLIPGRVNVMETVLDPIDRTISDQTFDGGFRLMNLTSGKTSRAYRLYNGTGGTGQPVFGKVNGMGDVTAMCSLPSIELGNRVWNDTNGNGVQDPGEQGIGGVTVHLYNSANVVVGTAVTDPIGEYYFVASTSADGNTGDSIGQVNGGITYNSAYSIRLDVAANYASGGPLFGLRRTQLNQTSQLGNDRGSDSDGDSYLNPTGSPAGTWAAVFFTTGGVGENDHTWDFGFVLAPSAGGVTLEGRIVTQNGNGIRNVLVTLVEDNGAVHTVLTGPFGYYSFEDLTAGQGVLVTISAKRYTFRQPARFYSLGDSITDADWVSDQ